MATQKKRPRRPAQVPTAAGGPRRPGDQGGPAAGGGAGGATSGAGPRRLGNQAQPQRQAPRQAAARPAGRPSGPGRPTTGAQRRSARRRSGPNTRAWGAVAVVVVVAVVLVAVKLTGGSTPNGTSGAASGRNPKAAPTAVVNAITTVPAAAFDAVGTDGQANPFTVTQHQQALTSGGKPEFVFYGAEYCPYCALMRWSLVAALGRFGTFHGLKQTSSDSQEGNIPTFSFIGATYTSKYLTFHGYEGADRNGKALETPPSYVYTLYRKYDGSLTSAAPAPTFNTTPSAGIPFLDVGNKYVSSGDPLNLGDLWQAGVLNNGGPGYPVIAQAIRNPTSSTGQGISASLFVAQANYISAAICAVDGGKPASVCSSPGVQAAAKQLAAAKPVG